MHAAWLIATEYVAELCMVGVAVSELVSLMRSEAQPSGRVSDFGHEPERSD